MNTITFERSGGVTGHEIYLNLDLDGMTQSDADRLRNLVEKADFFNIPPNLGMTASPDEFQYKVTVDNGSAHHSVRTTDTTMPRSLSPLIRELTMLQAFNKKVAAR